VAKIHISHPAGHCDNIGLGSTQATANEPQDLAAEMCHKSRPAHSAVPDSTGRAVIKLDDGGTPREGNEK
jgi:hypothetical protein